MSQQPDMGQPPAETPVKGMFSQVLEKAWIRLGEFFDLRVQGDSIVIGPSASGKTTSLAALHHAILNCDWELEANRVELRPISAPMKALQATGGRVIEEGAIPVDATLQVADYVFDLTLRQPLVLTAERTMTARFDMLDGPGGDMLTPRSSAGLASLDDSRSRLLERLGRCSGLLLCIDTCTDQRELFYDQIPALLADCNLERLAATRIVICMTKADQHFLKHGRGALRTAQCADPLEHARKMLTQAGVNALKTYVGRDAEIAAVFTSAAGFLMDEGTANWDPNKHCLLRSPANGFSLEATRQSWRPFQILEPYLFLGFGRRNGLRIVRARDL